MPSVINTNVASLNAQRNLMTSQTALSSSLQRLSSGLRINSAKDDAAGLAIADRMSSQIRGINQAMRNANDGISLAQTAEGSMSEVSNNLQRIRELAVQSANATNSVDDRKALDAEVQQRLAEINRVASQTSFNGLKLLDGSFVSQNFQIGANAGETITMANIASVKTTDLGLGAGSTAGTAVAGALVAGDLTVNGTDVGVAARDAQAIAAAINGNSTITGSGVTATAANAFAATFTNIVNTGTVSLAATGNLSSTVATSGITNGSLTINGAAITTGGTTTNAAALAVAINAQQGTTGVTATAQTTTSGALGAFTSTGGTAADTYSLNIDGVTIYNALDTSGAALTAGTLDTQIGTVAANLAAAGITYTGTAAAGTLAFSRADGQNVTITEAMGGGATGGFTTTLAGAAATYTSSVTLTSSNVITIGGNSPSTAGFNAGTKGADGTYTLTVGDGTTSSALAFDMSSGTFGMTLRATDIASKVNNDSTLQGLGITASIDANGKVAFAAADGRNVALTEASTGGNAAFNNSSTNSSGFANADATTAAVTHYGTVSLASTKDLEIGGTAPGDAGFTAGSYAGVNVLTVAGANTTLTAIDTALKTINSSRAALGAFQNRFESTIANLSVTSESLTSSRSRIQDADFAAETASLTRAQILQQAGTAMLAQANALPQNVLSLLRG